MKKIILSLGLVSFFSVGLFSQSLQGNDRVAKNLNNYRAGHPINEVKGEGNFYDNNNQVQFTNDVIFHNSSTTDQRNVKIACSVPGWLFAAYTTLDAGTGGIEIDRSKDGGLTWTVFATGGGGGLIYPAIDISVAGSDTNNLSVFICGILNNAGSYIAWIDKYDGLTGNFLGENFNETTGTNMMYDIVMANDFLNPSMASITYSVAVAYSVTYTLADSLIYVASLDGGTTYGVHIPALGTGAYLRKISIAYAHSGSWSNGRYAIAFESRNSSIADVGNIGFINNITDASSSFSTPIYLDSIDMAGMAGICRYPKVVAENDNASNDSSQLSAFVIVDRQYSTTDWDVLSFASELTINAYRQNWHRIDIENSGAKSIQGNGVYNLSNQNFGVTYYDSTSQHLNVLTGSYNMLAPTFAWNTVFFGYNDLTTNLLKPQPQMAYNDIDSSFSFAWNSEGVSGHGVALFDQELVGAGINNPNSSVAFNSLYPNPSSGIANFSFNLKENKMVQLSIVNLIGQSVVAPINYGNLTSGTQTIQIDLSTLADGVYIYQLQAGSDLVSGKITIAH